MCFNQRLQNAFFFIGFQKKTLNGMKNSSEKLKQQQELSQNQTQNWSRKNCLARHLHLTQAKTPAQAMCLPQSSF